MNFVQNKHNANIKKGKMYIVVLICLYSGGNLRESVGSEPPLLPYSKSDILHTPDWTYSLCFM